jgi:hypothetical protein
MHAYNTIGWENLFVAEAGAAAALSGLIFVAISINLSRILESSILPSRAVEALCKLVTVLMISTIGLVPGLTPAQLGFAILLMGSVAWFIPTRLQLLHLLHPIPDWNWTSHKQWILVRAIMSQLASIPFIVAGISLLLGHGGGLYWLVPGVILSFLGGMYGAWILLIEILR